MKVVHVINSLGVGGAEGQLIRLASKAGALGVKQEITPLEVVRHRHAVPSSVEIVSRHWRGPRAIGVLLVLPTLIQRMRADEAAVFVAWMYHSWLLVLCASLLARFKGRIFLYCRHGDPKTLKWSTRTIAKVALRMARWLEVPIVFNSDSAMSSHAVLTTGMRIFMIPNGFPVAERRGSLRTGTRTLGFLGRNHPDKGADLLPSIVARLVRELPDWRIAIAGPGMEDRREAILDGARAAGGDPKAIEVFGTVNAEQFFASLDVLMMPSRTESFPNVLVEATLAGVLVVANGVGDVTTLLDGNLELVADAESFVDAVLNVCRLTDGQRMVLSQSLAASLSSRFSIDHVVRTHIALWRDTCSGGRGH